MIWFQPATMAACCLSHQAITPERFMSNLVLRRHPMQNALTLFNPTPVT